LVSVGALELNLYVDGILVSFLPPGGRSLLYYTTPYLRLPLGVIAVAFATIVLPYFARVGARTPRRLPFYLHETITFMLWLMLPMTVLTIFFAGDIFRTMPIRFTLAQISQAQSILSTFALGLFFFALNKPLLNLFYALHETVLPTLITLVSTLLNTLLSFCLMRWWGVVGIAAATVFATAVQTVLLLVTLHLKFGFALSWRRLVLFLRNMVVHQFLCGIVAGLLFYSGRGLILLWVRKELFCATPLYWLWAGPCVLVWGGLVWYTRQRSGVRLYFVERA
jgi:peptidoglycan biosynthesis protein MviN/MurJ (putative lipid II flippase)